MEEVLTVKEVSQILKVNVHRVYDLIKSGNLRALKLGALKVRRSSLEEFLAKIDGCDCTDLQNIKPLDLGTIGS